MSMGGRPRPNVQKALCSASVPTEHLLPDQRVGFISFGQKHSLTPTPGGGVRAQEGFPVVRADGKKSYKSILLQ